jgi:hypothetical protein
MGLGRAWYCLTRWLNQGPERPLTAMGAARGGESDVCKYMFRLSHSEMGAIGLGFGASEPCMGRGFCFLSALPSDLNIFCSLFQSTRHLLHVERVSCSPVH